MNAKNKVPAYGLELARARDKWFETAQGRECLIGSTYGHYLKNRLERAFIAGYDSGYAKRARA